MRLGVICPSEIAIRRFMPALQQCGDIEFVGIGVHTKEERFGTNEINEDVFLDTLKRERGKAHEFIERYGGKLYNSYEEIVTSPDIDAVYIPLPPALHFNWAKRALEHGKHVLVEKPATTDASSTKELVQIASRNNVALHENYMFTFHEQLDAIDNIIKSGELGEIRLYRISFGFPRRPSGDFRYKKDLGGGALIDAGGYTLRYATRLLGSTTEIKYAQSNFIDEFEVDMYGSATLVNEKGETAQVAFGMDNNYKCELEVWGSKGTLTTGRVLTAPAGYIPSAIIRKGNEDSVIELPSDDAFLKSIQHFVACANHEDIRKNRFNIIMKQAELVDEFKRIASGKWNCD